MLQIISGKFFKSNLRQTNPAKGILYSNYSWTSPISTCIATLEPVDTFGSSVCSYVLNYVNQIEGEIQPGALAPTGDWEIIRQFQLLSTFGLQATFDVDRSLIELNCREKQKHAGDQYLPSKFTTRFFRPVINGNINEVNSFISLIEKVIGLPRKQYLAVIKCLTNFSNALQAINFNLDLAYSMLVYSLEALSQTFDGYCPVWNDHPQNDEIDEILVNVDETLSEEIRRLLMKDRHLKLTGRFVEFIDSHIGEYFYTEEASDNQNPVRKTEIKQALRNAYKSRSKYVHSLSSIPDHLKYSHVNGGDIFHWERQPYFTFNGLVRLTHHVVKNFIERQEYVEQEEYNYFQDIPGILTYQISSEYWLGNAEHFCVKHSKEWFSSFLVSLQASIIANRPIVDIEKVIQKIESLIKGVDSKYQVTMLAIHKLYCSLSGKQERYISLEQSYTHLSNQCHIEFMIANSILDLPFTWDLTECIESYENYTKNKFKQQQIYMPRIIEILLITRIANICLESDQAELYHRWLENARLEASGMPNVQNVIKLSRDQRILIQLDGLIKSCQQQL